MDLLDSMENCSGKAAFGYTGLLAAAIVGGIQSIGYTGCFATVHRLL
jgi:hypothetical protein